MPKPFAIRLEEAKKFFFDGKRVESMVDGATRKSLNRIGMFIMRQSKRGMRHKRTKRAPAPPAKKSPDKGNLRFILYAYEPSSKSVIIGPVKFRTPYNVASLHEFGGTVTQTRTRGRTRRVTHRTRARYPKRPYMRPALEQEAPKAANLFKEALEREARRKGRR